MFRELLGGTKPKTADSPAQPSQQPKGAAPASSHPIDTVLGTGAHFEGTLNTEGNVRVHGAFVGDITAQGKIAVGEHGKLEGNLTGEAVEVAGNVHGNILARKVSVTHSGHIWGDLRLEALQTEDGAFVRGLVTMEETVMLPTVPKPQEPVKEEPAANSGAPAAVPPKPEPVSKVEPAAKPEAKAKKGPAKAQK